MQKIQKLLEIIWDNWETMVKFFKIKISLSIVKKYMLWRVLKFSIIMVDFGVESREIQGFLWDSYYWEGSNIAIWW